MHGNFHDLAIGRDMEISMGGAWNFPIGKEPLYGVGKFPWGGHGIFQYPKYFFFKTCAGFDVKGTKPSFRTFLVTYLLLKLE